uniref:Venom peptide n=1 Tax=Comana monomorpha TaxID=1555636 RepID=A0AAU6PBX2_9NEOP
MNFKLMRWVVLFVLYCAICQMENVLPEGAIVDKNGKVHKPVTLPNDEITIE